ncbi:MAG: STAS domain-containing protein [Betaproteobacteria bacterium]|nr:STAS domain-containing protein [Betaproteobacteria bacterium]
MSVACHGAQAQPEAGADGGATAGFAAIDGGWRYTGDLTLDNAAAVFAASSALALPAGGAVDVSGLRHADSAALAVLIALKRRAAREHVEVALAGMPQPLHSLAMVYGVDELVA